MKRLLLPLLPLLLVAGCKTTEANYQRAYTFAKSHAVSSGDTDLSAQARAALERQHRGHKALQIVGADTLNIQTIMLQLHYPTGASLPQYSIMVHGFEQPFNAKAMCRRLRDNGLPNAYVAQTAGQTFYVAAAGTNSPDSLPTLLHECATKASSLGMPPTIYPIILRNAGYRPQK